MIKRFTRLLKRARRPLTWRIRTRRLFLMALPVALPTWLIYMLVLGCAVAISEIVRPIGAFWSAPPSREHSYYGVATEFWSDDLGKGLRVVPMKRSESA